METTQQEPTDRASTFKLVKSEMAWQQALEQLPNAHALQSWAWAEQKSRWGWTPIPLILTIDERNDQPLAAAMVLKRKLPRTPFCILYVPKGPALNYKDGALRRVALAELENIARQERAIFIKIDPEVVKSWGKDEERPSPLGTKLSQELKNRGWRFSEEQIQFRNTVELDLAQSEENLLAAMKSKTRYNIRLAGRKGIVVRPGTEADFPLMAEMYAETAVRDGFGIRPSAYYLDAWRSFQQAGMGHLLIAEFAGDPVAAVYLVRFKQRVIYMYGASTHKERQRMPNYLLQWEAIRWAKTEGCTVYDFWGAPENFDKSDRLWGVWRFKAGFNGQVVRHIGAWDYPVRPYLYHLYTVVLPKYLNYLRKKE